MNQEQKQIIHIGLPKTGTTFLQRYFFPGIPGITFFRGDYYNFGRKRNQETLLLSEEALSGLPWNENAKAGIIDGYSFIDSFKLAISNLLLIHPKARIIVVFRKQGSWLVSLYKQYIIEGGTLSFNNFYCDNGIISERDLDFPYMIQFLKSHFEYVDVLSFETFKAEGFKYYNRYFKSLGYGESKFHFDNVTNPGIRGRKRELLRRINKIYLKTPKFIQVILDRNRLKPRNIIRARINFWKPDESPELITAENQINLKFQNEWIQVEEEFWKEKDVPAAGKKT